MYLTMIPGVPFVHLLLIVSIHGSAYYSSYSSDSYDVVDYICSDSEPIDESTFVIEYTVTPNEQEWILQYYIGWNPVDQSTREDGRCGANFLAANGKVAGCDPTSDRPCCSSFYWCGWKAVHCNCIGCVDYRKQDESFREDRISGLDFLAPNGKVAECDPTSNRPCCSSSHRCGAVHCDCIRCADYRKQEQIFYSKLIFDDDGVRREPIDSSNCYIDGLAFNYSNVPKLIFEAPFTHQALLQVAYVLASEHQLDPVPITTTTDIFFETPDCYAVTSDAEFCASQSIARCGQPRDVSLLSASMRSGVAVVIFQWMKPVQVNDNVRIHIYEVQIQSADGDLVVTDWIMTADNVINWESEDELEEDVEYNLTVTPYVQKKLDPSDPSVPGRLVTYPFLFELPATSTLASPTGRTKPLAGPTGQTKPLSVVVLSALSLCLIVGALVLLCCKRRGRSRKPQPFQNLKMYAKNTEALEVDELLKNKEVPHDHVTIEYKLGEGEFGIVHKGLLTVTEAGKPIQRDVAIKTTKVGAHHDVREELLSEMKLIAELGDHPNILHLIASCSATVPYYLITEFMQYGDLLGFLRECRQTDNENLDPIYNVGEIEQLIIVRDIAKGMAHIQGKKFYHGDLAARNVLIGEKLSVKISDFGLADDLYTRGYKRREQERKIPIKWCSIETIMNGICSSQGDVWSFGILLYEVFTLGGTPYPGVPPRFLVTQLRQGYRMVQLDGCPDDVYALMKSCWQDEPGERPVFSSISEQLADMLMKRTDYCEFEMTTSDEEERYVSSPTQDMKNLAPINDEDNDVDIEQLHSALTIPEGEESPA